MIFTISAGCLVPSHVLFSSSAMAQTTDARKTEADRLLKQGDEQLTANQPEVALPTLQAALKLYQELKNRAAEGQSLKSIGNAYQALKEYEKAIDYQQQALEIARKIKDRNLEARALNNIGWAYDNSKNSVKALDYYRQSLTVSQSNQNIETENKTLANLGRLYSDLGESHKAISYHQQRLALAQRNNNIENQAAALSFMCIDYRKQSSFEISIQACQQALSLYKGLENKQFERASLLAMLGISYQSLGRYEDAINALQERILISQETNNFPEQAQVLCITSHLHYQIGQYGKAIDLLKQGLSIAERINHLDLEKQCLNILTLTLEAVGEYSESAEYSKKYLEISQYKNDFLAQVRAIERLLSVYTRLGDISNMLEYTQKLEATTRQINVPEVKSIGLRVLGQTYHDIADYKIEKGLDDNRKSILSQIPSKERQDFVKSDTNRSSILSGQFTKAELISFMIDRNKAFALSEINKSIEYLSESLTIVQKIIHDESPEDSDATLKGKEVRILDNLRYSYSYLDGSRAISYGKQALQKVRQDSRLRNMEANTLAAIGNTYGKNLDFTQAIDFYQQSLIAARRDKNLGEEGLALQALGSAFRDSGDLEQAEKTLFEAIKISESLRTSLESKDNLKVSFFEGQQQTYRTLEEVLIARKKPEAALEISERGRARIFIEQLRKSQIQKLAVNSASLPTIQQIKQTAQQQNATLVVYSIGIDPLPGIFKNRWKNLFVWIVKPTGEIHFRTVDLSLQQPGLEALIHFARQSIGTRSRSDILVSAAPEAIQQQQIQQNQSLQQLHSLLIEPIADLLPKDPNDRVIFIPQGSLFLVPFPALQDPNGKYLIEKHTILTAPSIQVLDQTQQLQKRPRPTAQTALVLGNPTMPKITLTPGQPAQQLTTLKGAEKEANAIAPLLNTTALTGNQGTKTTIVQQMPTANIIHLATHGILDDLRGLGSAIALAPDPNQSPEDNLGHANGLLTAEEILDMKLNAELVVLSACDTGRGKITGDGVIGLSRSFISAGVPSIIVSLWSVPDAPTAELMTDFYKNWKTRKLDKAQALRQAMLSTMKTHPNPRDWAAFTLIGEAE
jgi:CHAT domain-containing protein